ncbi:hypothetical protein Vafri_12749 [Volvox africanus]|uniref:F-box domain-containing protein n=1 Tax=Volvox africanus TaxID=51714 RepID=A0A8J4F4T7_9CHLO|nr:hypothetical protein Vafri_12749 [Volvox africanus]
MDALGNVVSLELTSAVLSKDLLESIFDLLGSHERRVTVPLVCKAWREAVTPSKTTSKLWEDVEVHDLQCRSRNAQQSRANYDLTIHFEKDARLAESISRWLLQRRDFLSKLTVFPVTAMESSVPEYSLALWSSAFGHALTSLATSSKLAHLTVRGPGVHAAACTSTGTFSRPSHGHSDPDAAGAILRGAFSLPSLHVLHVYDVPWAGSLHFAIMSASALASKLSFAVSSTAMFTPAPARRPLPSHLMLTNLRELVINRSFYQGSDNLDDNDVLDGGAVEAWSMLGRALKGLPLLERLDLAYTHALTYCDPARGVVAAPWPPLQKLCELSLAHDLSVQPPPSPPPPSPTPVAAASMSSQPPRRPTHGSVASDGIWMSPGMSNGSVSWFTWNAATATGAANDSVASAAADALVAGGAGGIAALAEDPTAAAAPPLSLPPPLPRSPAIALPAAAAAAAAPDASDACDLSDGENEGRADCKEALAGEGMEAEAAALPAGTEDVSLFGSPMLTVDAAHALVELHSWLPGCTALTSLDLRNCGLEAVPLAVAHLPMLLKLDLYGNPLVTMRLPNPLRSLVWLRFSLDPCYDMLYEMMVADAGEELAAEEMWTVELQAPQLQELEVCAAGRQQQSPRHGADSRRSFRPVSAAALGACGQER